MLALGAVGAIVFVVASAYVVSRDLPAWLAGAIGALAFPIGPIAWHVVGERGRRARLALEKKPPKSSLTAIDRLWLRVAGAAIVVIGPMIAVGGFDVARATWHHATWWVPSAPRLASSDAERLMRYVPNDAELVVVRIADRTCPFDVKGDAIAAWGDRQALLVASQMLSADNVDGVVREIDRLRKLPLDKVAPVKLDGGAAAIASYGWRARVEAGDAGPSDDIRAELARAPGDAAIIAAFVPRTLHDVPVRAGAAWLRADKENRRVVIEARVEAVDADAAHKLADGARAALASAEFTAEGCRPTLKAIAADVVIDTSGATVTGRVEVPADKLLELAFCAAK